MGAWSKLTTAVAAFVSAAGMGLALGWDQWAADVLLWFIGYSDTVVTGRNIYDAFDVSDVAWSAVASILDMLISVLGWFGIGFPAVTDHVGTAYGVVRGFAVFVDPVVPLNAFFVAHVGLYGFALAAIIVRIFIYCAEWVRGKGA